MSEWNDAIEAAKVIFSAPSAHSEWYDHEILDALDSLKRPADQDGWKSLEIRNDDRGNLDEIVAQKCDMHLEQMDKSSWFLGVNDLNGDYWQFWLGAKNKNTVVECRHTEHIPSAPTPEAK